jgi:hypothetical protein
MGKKGALFFVVFTLVYYLPPLCFANEAEITTKLDAKTNLINRFDVTTKDARFYYIDIRPFDEKPDVDRLSVLPPLWKIGIETPAFLLGSLQLHGLLKELENPAAYSPSSAVLFDTPGFSLDSALSKGRTSGTVIHLLPGQIHLFGASGPASPPLLGGYATVPMTEACTLSLVTMYGLDAVEGGVDTWFFENPPASEDTLLHTGVQLLFTSRFAEFGYAAGFSAGRFTMPGFFFRTAAAVTLPFLQFRGGITANNPDYRLPNGDFPDVIKAWEGSCTVLPEWFLSPHISYGRTMYRLPVIPVGYQKQKDTLQVGGKAEAGPFSLSGWWKWSLTYLEDGDIRLDQNIHLAPLFSLGQVRIEGSAGYRWDYYGESEKKAALGAVLNLGDFRFTGRCTVKKTDIWQLSGTVKGEYAYESGTAHAGISLEETDTSWFSQIRSSESGTVASVISKLAVTIGWKVKAEYPPIIHRE